MPSPVTPAEAERLKSLRSTLAPEEGLKTVETFAKYLLTSAATVGTLGAGANVSGVADLGGSGEGVFLAALVLIGLSLALAIASLIPAPVAYNPNQITSMERALSRLALTRQRILVAAGVLFAGGLMLAGAAPLVSSSEKHGATGIAYALAESGELSATLQVSNAEPRSSASIVILPVPGSAKAPRVGARSLLGAEGDGSVTVESALRRRTLEARIVATYESADGELKRESVTVPVRRKPGQRPKG